MICIAIDYTPGVAAPDRVKSRLGEPRRKAVAAWVLEVTHARSRRPWAFLVCHLR